MPTTISSRLVLAALLLCAGLSASGNAVAQTATNLNCKKCVGAKDLGNNAVTSKAIRKNAVKAKNLDPAAKPSGAGYAALAGPVALTTADQTVISLTMNVPGPGLIVASADFFAQFVSPNAIFVCALTTATTTANNFNLSQGTLFRSVSLTRAIPVANAGNVTVNLVCRETSDVEINAANLTGLFVPTRY